MALTADAVAGVAYAAGFRGEALVTAIAVAKAESTFDPDAHNTNRSTGDNSYGLWQINMIDILGPARRKRYNLKSNDALFDPATNARVAYGESGGGTNWKPWTGTYVKGKHRPFLDEARAAATAVEARTGSSSVPLEAAAPTSIAGEVPPPGGGLLEVVPVAPTIPALTMEGGTLEARAMTEMTFAGRIELSVEQLSTLTLEILDPRGPLPTWTQLLVGSSARLGDLDMRAGALEWSALGDAEQLTATLQARGGALLRLPDPLGRSHMWSDMSPTEVAARLAGKVGLRFYGKGTPRRTQIVQTGKDDAGQDITETEWELLSRLAREEGFWCFESAGALFFAPPTWLAEHGTRFPVRWRASSRELMWETFGMPTARRSVSDTLELGTIVHTLSFDLPRWRGEQVRPGMVAMFRGIPAFQNEDGTAKPFVVTDVAWDLDGGITPVHVEATEPIDPTPEPPIDDVGSTTGDDGTATDSAAGLGAGTPSGGPYGYQYDPVGTACSRGACTGARVLQDHLLRSFDGATDSGVYNCRKVAGTNTLSVHGEGRAGDVGCRGALGDQIAAWLVANAALIGVQQVIWERRSWNSKRREWATYTGENPHTDHVHWELCRAAAEGLTAAQLRGASSPLRLIPEQRGIA